MLHRRQFDIRVFLAVSSFLWMVLPQQRLQGVAAQPTTSYNEEVVPVADYPSWMGLLDDATLLTEISMPGSHDTMSLCVKESACALPLVALYELTRTQSMTLRQQLDSGIRALDLRIRYQDTALQDCTEISDPGDCSLVLYHGSIYQGFTMESDVMPVLTDFLDQNPSEMIIVRLKEEGSPSNPQRDVAVWTLLDEFKTYLVASGTTELGDARGKIAVMTQFISVPEAFLPLAASLLDSTWSDVESQDQFRLETRPELYNKWQAAKAFFATSANGDPSQFYANFLSGSGLVTPPFFVASGRTKAENGSPRVWTGFNSLMSDDEFPDFPRTACFLGFLCRIEYEGTNILAAHYLLDNQVSGTVGMVMADFPGARLIASIILQNDNISIESIELPPEPADVPCGFFGRLFGLCGSLL